MNTRRKVLLAISAGALLPLRAFAQPARVLRVGWLSNDKSVNSPFFEAFRSGMRDLGYVEGGNLVIEARFGEGNSERLDPLAVELVQLKPQIIVTQGGPATYPVIRAGATMPIVFGFSGDPIEGKLVQSYARPGGNMTGMTFLSHELVVRLAFPGSEILLQVLQEHFYIFVGNDLHSHFPSLGFQDPHHQIVRHNTLVIHVQYELQEEFHRLH